MSDTTAHLALPFIMAAQAQKHVTHNEALRLLDGLVQLSVLDRDLTAPPGSPADGDRYIVASGATGAWTGWDLNVALWTDGAWLRLPPRAGWQAWVEDEGLLLVYNGSAWIGTTPAALQNMALLGLGTTADAYDDWHEGRDPAGITTQDPELFKRFDPVLGGRRLKNYLKVMTLEAQTIARACGKNHLHNLEPEDLCSLTIEAAAMAGVPLAGTNWIPGRNGGF